MSPLATPLIQSHATLLCDRLMQDIGPHQSSPPETLVTTEEGPSSPAAPRRGLGSLPVPWK